MNSPFITIRFDKSHLSSIGARFYSQSLDLIRELVANAYDADATKVNIVVDSENLTVEDNGSGMNREGIEQYFTIGSPFKRENPTSTVFKRIRIGEFGIGKFADYRTPRKGRKNRYSRHPFSSEKILVSF